VLRSSRLRAQGQGASALRSDIHEEPPVKTGARRSRDFPDIHSASSAAAERHERVCGCSHSHQRRRNAPCRASGCNLSPALDLDMKLLEPNRASPTIACSSIQLLLPGEAESGSAGVQPDKEYPGRRCTDGAGPLRDNLQGFFVASIGHRSHASENAPGCRLRRVFPSTDRVLASMRS